MFVPEKVVIEEKALKYPMGEILFKYFKDKGTEVTVNKTGRVSTSKDDMREKYFKDKKTLVIGVRGKGEFQSCKPSAHYQLPLVSGCMGMCEYCYLNTQLGKRPYIKVYVNTDEILEKADKYAEERLPNITIFEGAATSDPIPVEPYTNSLAKAIEFFGARENTLFRFVTKYSDVDSLLNLKHNGKTTIRFSMNTDYVIKNFEHVTDLLEERMEAVKKVKNAGYKVGIIIAPVILYENWKNDYEKLINRLKEIFLNYNVEFEVISHRYTPRAKDTILSIYSNSKLPMDEVNRVYKYGQFGYGKYTYDKASLNDMKIFFQEKIGNAFGKDSIRYII